METLDNRIPALRKRDSVLGKLDGHQRQCNVLRRVRLGRRDTDFRSGVDVHTTVGLARDGRTDGVDDANAKRAAFQAVSEGEDRIGRLA